MLLRSEGAWAAKRRINHSASRPKRLAGAGPVERRVRPQFAPAREADDVTEPTAWTMLYRVCDDAHCTRRQRFESEKAGHATKQKRTKNARKSDAYQRIALRSQLGKRPTKRACGERVPLVG